MEKSLGKAIVHFTVTGGREAGVDLVLIQPFIKTKSTSGSRSLKGQDTKPTNVKRSIALSGG